MTDKKSILLIIGGGIAAYKCLDLVRRLKDHDIDVTPVLTKAGAEFVTPLSLATLSGNETHTDLFDLKNETEIGHIQLSRQADLVVVAPATADLMAKMAHGLANDLASTLLLATDKDVLVAPAMNVRMWEHKATQRNIEILKTDGVHFVGPGVGDMACGETGPGRLSETDEIITAIKQAMQISKGPLTGKSVLVTAGPTHEPIDPVRYIANRSSGKQGYAIAEAAVALGASVTLVSGPTKLIPPAGINLVNVETAREMRDATLANLPVDIAICTAAVADWRVKKSAGQKMKKTKDGLPNLELTENPDILSTISSLEDNRPKLIIGFAAETENVIDYAQKKLVKKGCDWIVANDVSPSGNVFGNDQTSIHIITNETTESLEQVSKAEAATALLKRAAKALSK